MKTSEKGINLIKSFEGCKLTAYQCPAKIWTIGYGHTGKVGLKQICKGMKITDAKAIALLKSDLKSFEKSVNTYVRVVLTQNQFDALVSFAYNEGAYNLKSSTLLKRLNARDYVGAADQFQKWNKADTDGDGKLEVLAGLTKRRQVEKALFISK